MNKLTPNRAMVALLAAFALLLSFVVYSEHRAPEPGGQKDIYQDPLPGDHDIVLDGKTMRVRKEVQLSPSGQVNLDYPAGPAGAPPDRGRPVRRGVLGSGNFYVDGDTGTGSVCTLAQPCLAIKTAADLLVGTSGGNVQLTGTFSSSTDINPGNPSQALCDVFPSHTRITMVNVTLNAYPRPNPNCAFISHTNRADIQWTGTATIDGGRVRNPAISYPASCGHNPDQGSECGLITIAGSSSDITFGSGLTIQNGHANCFYARNFQSGANSPPLPHITGFRSDVTIKGCGTSNAGNQFDHNYYLQDLDDFHLGGSSSDAASFGVQIQSEKVTTLGGFIYATDWDISNIKIFDNGKRGLGGGVYLYRTTNETNPVNYFKNCDIYNNNGMGIKFGGANFSTQIDHCTFRNNDDGATSEPYNIQNGSGMSFIMNYSILTGTAVSINTGGGSITGAYNLIDGSKIGAGSLSLTGTLAATPTFVSSTDDHLTVGSPGIDGAVGSTYTTDLDGSTRPVGGVADMGAYEFAGTPAATTTLAVTTSTTTPAVSAGCQRYEAEDMTIASGTMPTGTSLAGFSGLSYRTWSTATTNANWARASMTSAHVKIGYSSSAAAVRSLYFAGSPRHAVSLPSTSGVWGRYEFDTTVENTSGGIASFSWDSGTDSTTILLDYVDLCDTSTVPYTPAPLTSQAVPAAPTAGTAAATGLPAVVSATPTGSGITRNVTDMTTFNAALAAANPGDVLSLATGTYTRVADLSLSRSGTAANPIVIISAVPASPAIITGNFYTYITGSYWSISQVTYQNVALDSSMFIDTSTSVGVRISNVTFTNVGNQADASSHGTIKLYNNLPGDAYAIGGTFRDANVTIDRNTVTTPKNSFVWEAPFVRGTKVLANTITGPVTMTSPTENEVIKIGWGFGDECVNAEIGYNTITNWTASNASTSMIPYTIGIKASCVNVHHNLLTRGRIQIRHGANNTINANVIQDGTILCSGNNETITNNWVSVTDTAYDGLGPLILEIQGTTGGYDGTGGTPLFRTACSNGTITGNTFISTTADLASASELATNTGNWSVPAANNTIASNTFYRPPGSAVWFGSFLSSPPAANYITTANTWNVNNLHYFIAPPATTRTVTMIAFRDLNANGVKDTGDSGLVGAYWRVRTGAGVITAGGYFTSTTGTVTTQVTIAAGYTVTVYPPSGQGATTATLGNIPASGDYTFSVGACCSRFTT